MVAGLRQFNGDVMEVEPIEQVPGQFSSGPGKVRTGGIVFGKDAPGPELRPHGNQHHDE